MALSQFFPRVLLSPVGEQWLPRVFIFENIKNKQKHTQLNTRSFFEKKTAHFPQMTAKSGYLWHEDPVFYTCRAISVSTWKMASSWIMHQQSSESEPIIWND